MQIHLSGRAHQEAVAMLDAFEANAQETEQYQHAEIGTNGKHVTRFHAEKLPEHSHDYRHG